MQYGDIVGNGPSLDVPLAQPPPSLAPSNGAHVQSASRYLHDDQSGEIKRQILKYTTGTAGMVPN